MMARKRAIANGVIVSTSTEFTPRNGTRARSSSNPVGKPGKWGDCVRCLKKTNAEPDYYGRRRCKDCLNPKPPVSHMPIPGHEGRVEALAAMYAEVAKYPTESAARAAGLPTTKEEFLVTYDNPTEVGGNDEEDAEDDGE